MNDSYSGLVDRNIPLIVLNDVSKTYRVQGEALVALSRLSFDVAKNEFVSIVGPTGCGKTTLLRMIAGLVKPTGGYIQINNMQVFGPSRQIGIVFQRPTLLQSRTIKENLSLPTELIGMRADEHIERINPLLQFAGLDQYQHCFPHELSVGMQQIVSLCMALVTNPEIILMDEPFSALDALTREHLGQQLLKIWSQYKKTVIFVTHSIQEAVFLSDRVVVLSPRPGRVISSITINAPRPRLLSLLETQAFLDLSNEVRLALTKGSEK
jgi:NitT/TauT family transport system ATP-binding protein